MRTRAGAWRAASSRVPERSATRSRTAGRCRSTAPPGRASTIAVASAAGSLAIPSDDVLVAVADDDPGIPVHAAWHHIELETGPYTIEGELATLPGFDPGRALTRPSGEFLLLRDVRCRCAIVPRRGSRSATTPWSIATRSSGSAPT